MVSPQSALRTTRIGSGPTIQRTFRGRPRAEFARNHGLTEIIGFPIRGGQAPPTKQKPFTNPDKHNINSHKIKKDKVPKDQQPNAWQANVPANGSLVVNWSDTVNVCLGGNKQDGYAIIKKTGKELANGDRIFVNSQGVIATREEIEKVLGNTDRFPRALTGIFHDTGSKEPRLRRKLLEWLWENDHISSTKVLRVRDLDDLLNVPRDSIPLDTYRNWAAKVGKTINNLRTEATIIKWLQGSVIAPEGFEDQNVATALRPVFDATALFASDPDRFSKAYWLYRGIMAQAMQLTHSDGMKRAAKRMDKQSGTDHSKHKLDNEIQAVLTQL